MPRMINKKPQAEQRLVDEFNAAHPIGTLVRYWPGSRKACEQSYISETRSAAWLLGGHTAVVQVQGRAGCIALSHVEPEQPGQSGGPNVEQRTSSQS